MKKLLQLTAIASAMLFSVSVYADQHANTPKQTINVGVDQHLVRIALPANATTGYQWYVSNYNTELMTLSSYHYLAPTNHRVGAGGTAEFTFTVKPAFHVAPQITEVDFIYGQSWDMTGATSRVISLTSIPTYVPSSSSSREQRARSEGSANKPATSSSTTPTSTAPGISKQQPMPAPTSTEPAASSATSPSSTDTSWLTIPGQS